jgi:hypothetical protein
MINQENEYKVNPPWIEYPNSEPIWSGWRQGTSENWLHENWLPFWRALSEEERRSYLQKFPPPTDDWAFYLNVAWVN